MRIDVVMPDPQRYLRRDLAAMLHPDVDACYVPRSHVPFKLPHLIEYLVGRRLAHLVGIDEMVQQGALLTYGARRHSHWEPMALMLRDVLAGSIAREMPFERPRDFVLAVNAHQAMRMGVRIPKNILRRANVVV